MRVKTILPLAAAILMSFLTNEPARAQPAAAWKVETSGAMREMFETGSVAGRREIGRIAPQKNLYGVGPLDGLTGEIMILDGVPLTSFMAGGAVRVAANERAKAVFFVWANVEKWLEADVPETVKTYDELERFIAAAAARRGLDPAGPFPFLLRGKFASVAWHVNDYRADGTPLTREKHDAMKFRAESKAAALEMVGFFSTRHKGVFTHHTRTTHIHATDAARTFVGHVDELAAGGVKLFLPEK